MVGLENSVLRVWMCNMAGRVAQFDSYNPILIYTHEWSALQYQLSALVKNWIEMAIKSKNLKLLLASIILEYARCTRDI